MHLSSMYFWAPGRILVKVKISLLSAFSSCLCDFIEGNKSHNPWLQAYNSHIMLIERIGKNFVLCAPQMTEVGTIASDTRRVSLFSCKNWGRCHSLRLPLAEHLNFKFDHRFLQKVECPRLTLAFGID